MNTAQQRIISVEYSLVALLLFILPLFFLPFTFEFFATNKMYLLSLTSLVILLVASFRLLIQRKITLEKSIVDIPVLMFFIATALSSFFASDNPVQALLNPYNGLVTLGSLSVIYMYVSRQEWEKRSIDLMSLLIYSSCILAVITGLVFLGVLKNVGLTGPFAFLKNQFFSPTGTVFDLVAVLGYFLLYQILRIIYADKAEISLSIGSIIATILTSVGFAFALIMALQMNGRPEHVAEFAQFPISVRAAVSIRNTPGTLLFGFGVDDFSAAYTLVKNAASNIGPLWQIDSFNLSRSALLHILTETGLFGFASFVWIIGALIMKILKSSYPHKVGPLLLTLYVIVIFTIFPASLLLFFLAYLTVAFTACDLSSFENNRGHLTLNLHSKSRSPILLTLVLMLFSGVIAGGYFISRSYRADNSFRSSFDSINDNDPQKLYENQRNAVILNPYVEQYRVQLAKTNVVIANEVAGAVQNSGKDATLQQKQIVTEAVQAAIAQAKAAATLNPTKANNWEAMGTVYANVTGIASGSPQWAISAYSRAISLDPMNAKYHSKLGSVYYMMGRYGDAANSFVHATTLKPDWASAWYNLAWSQYKAGKIDIAISSMNKSMSLINRSTSPDDYRQAVKDLESFKNGQ